MAYINGKSLGKKKPLFDEFSLPLSREQGESLTLQELLEKIVKQQVAAFQDRQQQRQFLRVLTERQIAEGLEKGKVESGQSDVPVQDVDVNEAIETAIQAFADGLYLVVIDEESITSLETPLEIREDSRITFVRLSLLAGG